jgi:FtsP/CotA-like multicopper oxidase with cupredoxin domain
MTRRSQAMAGVMAAALLSGCGPSTPAVTVPVEFDHPLSIPALAPSQVAADGTRVFTLSAREGAIQLLDGRLTSTWGFNGDILGPTLRAKRGQKVAVEVTNELPEATTVHWHGMHLPAVMDGGPHQMIEPGTTWRPTWTIDQPAATLWYHPHPHGTTEEHVYRGLAGMFILDDAETAATQLPSRYGVDDIPVIVQDKALNRDGELIMDNEGNEIGMLGSTILVNGTIGPYQEVTSELTRLRLLNGSTARTYDFGFDDGRTFELVGTDGGLLAAPHSTDRIRLSPGERAEIVVRMDPGTTAKLRSFPPNLGSVAAPVAFGGKDTFDILELRAAERLAASTPVPARFAGQHRIDPAEAAVTRQFVLEDRAINGKRMEMDRIDEVVRVGTTEIWEVTNRNPFPHNFHIHDVQFELLTIDGTRPPPDLVGRKDTIYLEPRRSYRLIMRFEDYADDTTPYMFHCHLLLHEDEGMMGQFVVTDGTHVSSERAEPIRPVHGYGSHRENGHSSRAGAAEHFRTGAGLPA